MGDSSAETVAQRDICPFALREISRLAESLLGHLRCDLANVPPQPNSPSDHVIVFENGCLNASLNDQVASSSG